ncbi:MAG TPA: alkaline phosphatase D family protein [Pirellulales bacterium]|jgi:alkaline phosphatase D|nr:alkaline phosphatase D family protein [Pirellulales bacterium]
MTTRIFVPGRSWSRREFLVAGGAFAAWPQLAAPQSALARRRIALKDYPFQLGVASGDPVPEGFVIWTRLAPEPLTGGGMPSENVEVDWHVSLDERFKQIVARGTAIAAPELAHSVHVEVDGLEPGRWYWYQFSASGETSPIGRARTAPPADDVPQRLRFAFASCQHYEQGLFTAYEHMAREELDLIVHLGDYIYEYGAKEKLVRKHVGPECITLDEYRNRHAQYKTDEHLRAAHAICPWLVTWDDHEFDNDYSNDVSEEAGVDPKLFLSRRARAYQAYYEHMPLRRAQVPMGPEMLLYRRASFGCLAQFAILDERQYRTDQPGGGKNVPPPPEALDPKATLLGDKQEQWLYATLSASPARWNVLAQGVMMARVDRKPGDEVGYSMDQWPGYEANRQRMLRYFADHRPSNPVVITGDIHSNWVNDLQVGPGDAKSPIVATEFVGTSISSGGNGSQTGKDTEGVLAENPFVRFYNRERGYVSCEVTPERWTSHYRVVEDITKPGAPLVTRKSFIVESGRCGVQDA